MKKIEDVDPAKLYEQMKNVMALDIKRTIIPIPYMGNRTAVIDYETKELIALCPMTGLPDFYKLTIIFIPDDFIPELKYIKNVFL